jgi:hypothetical protein
MVEKWHQPAKRGSMTKDAATKVELLTEAIEALVTASVAKDYAAVRLARIDVHDAVAELLKPVLRVVH